MAQRYWADGTSRCPGFGPSEDRPVLPWLRDYVDPEPLSRVLYRPTIVGTENVPKTGEVILASSHLSFIDSFAIPLAAPRRVHYLAKNDYFTGTGLRGFISREVFYEGLNCDPGRPALLAGRTESLEAALKVLGEGEAFGIYPEGTRSRDGRLYRGRTGWEFLALTAKVPVVPVALAGTQNIQPVDAVPTPGQGERHVRRTAGVHRAVCGGAAGAGHAGGSRTRSWTPSRRFPARNGSTATTRSLPSRGRSSGPERAPSVGRAYRELRNKARGVLMVTP